MTVAVDGTVMWTAGNARGRLQDVIDKAHLPIDAPCRALLATLVDGAVERLAEHVTNGTAARDGPGVASSSVDVARVRPSPIDDAVVGLQRIIDDMTQQSRILRFDAIHPPNFHSAIERLRPLWPFC